jgi:hypothetical protein
VRPRVLAQLHADPPPPHLVRHRRRRSRTEKRIQNEIAGVRGNFQNALEKQFRFWGVKGIFRPE